MIFCALPTSLSNQSIEEKDQTLHTKVKAILHDCKKRNDHFHLGYEYLTTSMRVALKHLLLEEEGHDYWNAVEQKLAMMLEEQQNKQNETFTMTRITALMTGVMTITIIYALDVPGSFCGYTILQSALDREAPLDLLLRMVELAPSSSRTQHSDCRELALHTVCE